MKRCPKCGKTKAAAEFHKNGSAKGGLQVWCKACCAADYVNHRAERLAQSLSYHAAHRTEDVARARLDRHRHPAKFKARAARWYAKHPGALSAHRALNDAVRRGKLVRPNACQECGRETELHGHHENYSRKLDVTFLCALCHKAEHKTSKREG